MKTTIDMAREAGAMFDHMMWLERDLLPVFQRFEAIVRADERNRTWTQEHWTDYERSIAAAEREACERAVEELLPDADRGDCAAAIRARRQA